MKNLKKVTNILSSAVLVAAMPLQSMAMSIDWTGVYRTEFTQVSRPTLGTPQDTKYYGLNYLGLSPKIIAADGVNIISRFDVLGQDTGPYANSQVGQIWGSNNNVGTVPNNGAGVGAAGSRNQGTSNLKVSQLYLNVNQEYGALIVGRAPYHFGTGITFNAGSGAFDHWYQTRDMVAYKFIVGDWSFMPMSSRIYSQSEALGNSINELYFQLMYENKDSRSSLGVVQGSRKGSNAVNDLSIAAYDPAASATVTGDLNLQKTNFFLSRDWDSFGLRFEAGFESGETGLTTATGQGINVSAYGIATELLFPRSESKWNTRIRLGMASGDNPETAAYEGFQFDQNYDVAMLMFNHRLGKKDFFYTNRVKDSSLGVANSVDDEAIGNTLYISPAISYAWSDRLDLKNTFTYAQLMTKQQNSVDVKKDLGIEWDIELIYKPVEKIQWVNQLGILFPGSAWKDGASNFENGATYGFTTKAAISF